MQISRELLAAIELTWNEVQNYGVIVAGIFAAVVGIRTRTVKELRGEVTKLREDLNWERNERDLDRRACETTTASLQDQINVLRGENNVLIGGIGEKIAVGVISAVVTVAETLAGKTLNVTKEHVDGVPGSTSRQTD